MSDTAIVTARKKPSLELYIHYDGDDKEMIEEIVALARSHHARNVNVDESYGMARLVCACGEYFQNEETGFGISKYGKSCHDYHYVIEPDWTVTLESID